jgi:hypothetical protein
MSAKTLAHDEDISQALVYYNTHNTTSPNVSYRQVGKLFCVDPGTLFQHRNKEQRSVSTNGGCNSILNPIQRAAICAYMKDQYTVGLPCSTPMILSAVCHLCDQETPLQLHPTIQYIRSLMKSIPNLHKVKCKPIDYKQHAAQDIDAIREWFQNYTHILEQHKIPPNCKAAG